MREPDADRSALSENEAGIAAAAVTRKGTFSRELLLAVGYGAVELLVFFPLALAAFIYLSPADLPLGIWLVLLLACYPLGRSVGSLMKRLPKLLGFAGTALAGAALTYAAVTLPAGAFGGIGPLNVLPDLARAAAVWVIACFLLGRGAKLVRRSWADVFPSVLYAVGLIAYFLASVVARFAEAWKPYSSTLWWVGLCAVLVCLFLTNRRHLQASAYTGENGNELAASVRSQNTIWTVVIFGVVLIAAAFTQIKDALVSAFKSTVRFIFWLFSLLGSESEQPPPEPEQSPPPQQQLPPPGEPSRFAEVLEKIFFIFAYTLITAAVIYGLYRLVKFAVPQIRRLIRKLMEQWGLGRSADEARSGYVDEKQSLLDWADVPAAWGKSVRDRLSALLAREPKWDDLRTNRERVRYLYRLTVMNAMKRGYDWQSSSTPAETMRELERRAAAARSGPPEAQALSAAYEEARYGERDISDERAAKLRKDALK
ncbi:DUF4129 domain-containing protein [Paenibacillus contaminans]|uniref:Protein-glutamine gamma-glutamyltransferase-like C-terminal domain-containing protein n=1 Tax=Paenibacillus contaminans TaxID=450362 RepID=A0A329MKR5_9BACL|nr:DUF4129 domain-containing protein [Paenibacillus contaminans]RAV20230.1 hypothetical protein DQG23_17360 [Paenibacillus contaminans]